MDDISFILRRILGSARFPMPAIVHTVLKRKKPPKVKRKKHDPAPTPFLRK